MMNKFIRILPLVIIFLNFSTYLYAKTINSPELPAEQAIVLARQYVQDNNIDVSRHFLVSVEYIGLYDEYNKPFWRIEYRLLAFVKGGQIIISVYGDGTIGVGYGE